MTKNHIGGDQEIIYTFWNIRRRRRRKCLQKQHNIGRTGTKWDHPLKRSGITTALSAQDKPNKQLYNW